MEIEGIVARSLQVLIALGGAYLVATWFVLIVWTYRDIESRSKNVVTQVFSTLLSVFFWVPGVLLYMLLRPKETLDEAYQKSLEEEYLLQDLQELPVCPTCNHFMHDEWQICPHCGVEQHEHAPQQPMVPIARLDAEAKKVGWVDPAQIEQRLKAEASIRQGTHVIGPAHEARPIVTEEIAAVPSDTTPTQTKSAM